MSRLITYIKVVDETKFGLPEYKTPGSAGMDLKANIDEPVTLLPMERHLFPTGIKMQLPGRYEAQIRPRSGLACKHGITVVNSPGTIDADYRGEIGVCLINLSNEAYTIEPGERIAQMVIAKCESKNSVFFKKVDSLDESERGEGGYGHTGK